HVSGYARPRRQDDRGRHGRSRRKPLGTWGGDARLLHLREHRARAADHSCAVLGPRGPSRRRRRPQRRRAADGARPAGQPAPKKIEGASVTPLMSGTVKDLGLETYSEALYPLHHFGWSDLRAMRSGRYKLIAAPRP